MLKDVCLMGRPLNCSARLRYDKFYDQYLELLRNFNTNLRDEEYVRGILEPKELEVRDRMMKKLNEKKSERIALEKRLKKYSRHCELSDYNELLRFNTDPRARAEQRSSSSHANLREAGSFDGRRSHSSSRLDSRSVPYGYSYHSPHPPPPPPNVHYDYSDPRYAMPVQPHFQQMHPPPVVHSHFTQPPQYLQNPSGYQNDSSHNNPNRHNYHDFSRNRPNRRY